MLSMARRINRAARDRPRRDGPRLRAGVADAIDVALRELGYRHVTVDLRGYRLGSLNDALRLRPV